MKQSMACACSLHESCDGTIYGAALGDDAFLKSVGPVGQCQCLCHIARAAAKARREAREATP